MEQTAIEPRTKFLDYDSRRRPKTDVSCVKCQKDLKPNQARRWVRIIKGGSTLLHPQDESMYTSDAGDCGWYPIGCDCARQIGLEWSVTMPF